MPPGVVTACSVDRKGREWERICVGAHIFVLGPDLAHAAPFCWGHKSATCWGQLSFSERKAVADAEPLRRRLEPAW